ncbi:DUF4271 domain-containing protein [Aquimarina celericrescens]|uniref:DUF4271 domain-containing protein n=1 Tax=Aquimarina celericrescens TaxID=1964542 RepID=A0ABW5AX89_9FLAO|nr:DUF4271 domain-containing protein [Aquimarina celericrescens]
MEYITREIVSTNWLTILLLICLGLLAIAKGLNALRFSDFMMLFSNNKYIISYQKPNKLSSPFNAVLLLLQIASVSLFLYLYFDIFELQVVATEITLYIKITIIYAVIVICKLLIEKIIATIFSIDGIVDEYLFYKVSYRNFLGVILLPFNIVFIYALQPTRIVYLILVILLIILNLVVLVSFYRKNENIIFNHLFYFILYLCALEIAPYFILYKLISN